MTNSFPLFTTPGLKTPADSKTLPPGRMIGSAEMRCQIPQGGVWFINGKATSVRTEIKVVIFRREFDINVNFEVRLRSEIAQLGSRHSIQNRERPDVGIQRTQ